MRTYDSKAFRRLATVVILATTLSGCYYTQLVSGQLKQWNDRQPVEALINDTNRDPELAENLRTVASMVNFAHVQYGIDVSDSYRYYINTGDAPPQWLVSAAPALSVEPKQWCYPIAGCVNYRNFWQREDADEVAAELSQRGYDVSIFGASAWSTLGWFSDPIMSNWLSDDPTETSRVLFHEIAHRAFYVSDDPDLNEAFASFFGDLMAREWAESQGLSAPTTAFSYDVDQRIADTRSRLSELYNSTRPKEEKLLEKYRIFEELSALYPDLDYLPSNNAELAMFSTYYLWVPAWQQQWHSCEDAISFLKYTDYLTQMPSDERRAALGNNNCDSNEE